MPEFVGFNSEEVKKSINGVQKAYDGLCVSLGSTTQSKFVSVMANEWACKEAQDFFGKVNTAVESLRKDIDKVFGSVVDSMNSAGKAWAARTGNQAVYSSISFAASSQKIDVSVIKENINGDRGITPGASNKAKTGLSAIKNSADSNLTSAVNAVKTSGFLGGNQQNDLENALKTIKKNIDTAIENLNSELDKAINSTNQNYTDLSTTVSSGFNGS